MIGLDPANHANQPNSRNARLELVEHKLLELQWVKAVMIEPSTGLRHDLYEYIDLAY